MASFGLNLEFAQSMGIGYALFFHPKAPQRLKVTIFLEIPGRGDHDSPLPSLLNWPEVVSRVTVPPCGLSELSLPIMPIAGSMYTHPSLMSSGAFVLNQI